MAVATTLAGDDAARWTVTTACATTTASSARDETFSRFFFPYKSHRFFHYFSRATDAGDDARPLDGDNGMCDDDGLLRS